MLEVWQSFESTSDWHRHSELLQLSSSVATISNAISFWYGFDIQMSAVMLILSWILVKKNLEKLSYGIYKFR